MFGTAGPRCEHVFRELYENAPYMDLRFLRLKVVELLMLLSRIPQEEGTDLYCSTEQTELAHHLRDHLLTNREGYVSLRSWQKNTGSRFRTCKKCSNRSTVCQYTTISRNTVWNRLP